MSTENTTQGLRGLSIFSLVAGALGGLFCWWLPLGMVLSLTGLVFGFVDLTAARRRSLDYRLSIAAIVLSVATLILNAAIAYFGLQLLTFGELR
jgi:hypothetical protein